ncbi:MAG: type II toxin-antitoxin system Phd/YefM family antitoxin [Desulfatiglans sp.]|nr:type II toxin-antitoxin system Phd/YefM family antitoxin [Desulfatiglans sp.]
MSQHLSLTEAKAKFSELITRVHFGKEKFTITRKGKAVALVSPVSETENSLDMEGLICARGALSEIDKEIDELVADIYINRDSM